ncbi:DUF2474 family protein [Pseudoroseomonas cervicalis]|nr:DUF2474 family protein [Pseudoroseomonas cervicalis]WBV42375.1 DUF2474 family protein [Pseudoroseomonas cervicalis]
MQAPPLWRRLGWFLLLWLGGVASLTLVAGLIRWALLG